MVFFFHDQCHKLITLVSLLFSPRIELKAITHPNNLIIIYD